jgi:6-phosphogluconolactonase
MRHLLFACSLCLVGLARSADAIDLYVGTGGDGIYRTEFDPESGELSDPVKVAQTERPTFIWIHASEDQPQRSHLLYSICELGRGKGADGAAIVSWSIDPDSQRLTQTSRQDAEHDGPCFVTVSADGRYAALANYGGGSVALFPILDDGSLAPASAHMQHTGSSVNLKRQREPHAHSIRFDPSDRRVAACDLGTDKVYLYDVGSGGSLTPSQPAAVDMPAGSGPRHLVFSPDEKYLLVLGELSGQITTLRYAPPKVSLVETISTMSADTPAEAPRGSAEILFHPGGRFVYCSNRGPSEIACFEYDSGSGRLKRTSAISSGGVHPRNFRISPDGRFLLVANQMTDNIVVFRIDPKTGRLTKTATELGVPKPMCLKFL